jgi:hypothetical protein
MPLIYPFMAAMQGISARTGRGTGRGIAGISDDFTRPSKENMNEDQQLEKVSSVRRPWTEAWEQAWEAYQGQQKPGGDEKLASFRNRAKQENDARYLGDKYFKEVCQYLPKSECPPT